MDYVTGEDGGSTIKVDWKESSEEFLMYDATDKTVTPTTFRQTSGNQFEGTLPSESGSYYAVYGDDANLVSQDGTLNEDYVWMKSNVITDLTKPIEFKHITTILKPDFIIENKNVNASITQIVMDDANAFTITPQEQDIFIFLPIYLDLYYPQGREFKFIVTIEDIEYVGTLTIANSMIAGQFYTAKIHLEEKTGPIPYVTFTVDPDDYQTLTYTGNDLEYSLDGTTFVDLEANDVIEFSEDGKLYLRGDDNFDGTKDGDLSCVISFGNNNVPVACTGDIRTLIDYDDYENAVTSNATFIRLFKDCTELTSAPELPATNLAKLCYQSMFSGCTSLTVAPKLPAETLAISCYMTMFSGCTKLEKAPALPATTLENSCYESMFNDCTSLIVAPALPATTLAKNCYAGMFKGTSLEKAPALPVTTLAESCYSWMFQDCTSLTEAPKLPATILTEDCYLMMFSGCTKLETAPELPATTLADFCYYQMFSGCTNLSYIKMLATNISATDCLYEWVKGVATSGTFIKDASMTSLTEGVNGIPTGWDVNP